MIPCEKYKEWMYDGLGNYFSSKVFCSEHCRKAIESQSIDSESCKKLKSFHAQNLKYFFAFILKIQIWYFCFTKKVI